MAPPAGHGAISVIWRVGYSCALAIPTFCGPSISTAISSRTGRFMASF